MSNSHSEMPLYSQNDTHVNEFNSIAREVEGMAIALGNKI